MYFPYLRGKQQELRAIKATAAVLASSGKVIPILEPVVAKPRDLVDAVGQTLNAGAPLIVISNPTVGAHAGVTDVLPTLLPTNLRQHPGLIPAQIIETETTAAQVHAFLKRNATKQVCFVHLSTPKAPLAAVAQHVPGTTHVYANCVANTYIASLQGDRVCLQDRFNRMARNASYISDEFFSDDHLTFKSGGLKGFADYSMVGQDYFESGGPAHAVAIHLHHEEANGLWLRHFVSDRKTGLADVAGKFAEALAKLVTYGAKKPNMAATAAFAEFRAHHKNQHFPGLAVVKQLSLRHHIEMMTALL